MTMLMLLCQLNKILYFHHYKVFFVESFSVNNVFSSLTDMVGFLAIVETIFLLVYVLFKAVSEKHLILISMLD
jgi:hypothetical protein